MRPLDEIHVTARRTAVPHGTVLGGVVTFTTLHYLLNVAYSVALVSIIHAASPNC